MAFFYVNFIENLHKKTYNFLQKPLTYHTDQRLFMIFMPCYDDIRTAARRIRPYAHKTPVLTSHTLNKKLNCQIYFKCENFQKVGAFKFRGACNTVFSIPENQLEHGFATHSSGNHAQALALAAKLRHSPAYIVMPENAPEVKKKAVADYGAEIIFCAPTLQARESTLAGVVERTGATFVHPYDNASVIAGQGTAALELLAEMPSADIILTPVGGGGLLSGTALAVKSAAPGTQIMGVEPAGADDAYRSFQAGHIIPSRNPKTIADGLLTSLSELTFSIIQNHVTEIITVSESEIISAMRFVWERMKIVIEPSSAVPVAAVLFQKMDVHNKHIGIIISGGNVDLARLPFTQ
jgi:threonine dehydratase